MSDIDWQRLSPWSVLSFTFGTAKTVLTQGYTLIPFLFAGWKKGFDSPLVIGIALAVTLGILINALVQYFTYRFRPGATKLEVHRGLWFVRKDELPLDKIQNVRLEQPFYLRPLKLCTLVVETAGSTEDEVSIAAMEMDAAQALKAHLLGKTPTGATTAQAEDAPEDRLLLKRSPKELLLFGLYHNNLVWLMVFAGSIMGQLPVDDILESLSLEAAQQFSARGTLMATLLVAGLALLALMLFSLLSVLFAFLKYHPYQLRLGPQQDPSVERSGGIIAHQQDALALRRVQLLEFHQPPIARLMKRWTLFFRQVEGNEVERHIKLPLLAPALTESEFTALLAKLPALPGGGETPPMGQFLPIHPGWMKRRVLLSALPAIAALALTEHWIVIELALTASVLAALGVWLRYRHWGYRLGDGVIWHRSGLLGQSIKRIPLEKVQHVGISQSPGQRNKQVANLHLGLASGELHLPWLPLADAQSLAEAALTRIRTDNHNWI